MPAGKQAVNLPGLQIPATDAHNSANLRLNLAARVKGRTGGYPNGTAQEAMRCSGVIRSWGTRTRRSCGTCTTVVEYGTRGWKRAYQSSTCRSTPAGSIQPFQGSNGTRRRIAPAVAGSRHMATNAAAEQPPAMAQPLRAPTEVPTTISG